VTRDAALTVTHTGGSITDAIDALVDAAPFVVLTSTTLENLAHELGGYGEASRYLLGVVERIGHPIGLHVATGPDTSRTVFVGPRSWSAARLKGWTAAHHQELEAAFGRCTGVGEL
jgi:hypothetical protein